MHKVVYCIEHGIHLVIIMFVSGVGMQFLTLATGIMVMAMFGMFNVHRHGQINSAGVILYAFTSCKCLL